LTPQTQYIVGGDKMISFDKREILLALSFKHKGNWDKIYADLEDKVAPTDEEIVDAKMKLTSNYVTFFDDEYPDYLKRQGVFRPPLVLYYYGNISLLNSKNRVACVGSRYPKLYQLDKTYELVLEACKTLNGNMTVVSGMAVGIDRASMLAAIYGGGNVIAVLGGGIDYIYPTISENIYEFCKNSKRGLVISEYPINTSPEPSNFVFRNRLIVEFSNLIFIGGARSKSGTATTASLALSRNKEIYALPCNADGDNLTNSLIKDGCGVILSVSDLVDAINDESKQK
jgi:DNA processing protein